MKIRLNPILVAGLASLLFTACVEQQLVYVSPYPNIQTGYTVTPLLRDSLKVASYGSFAFTNGSANHNLSDRVFIVQGKFHQSFQVAKNLQMFYGVQGSAGSYRVNWSDNYYYPITVDPDLLPVKPGPKFTGSVGAIGGMNLIVPVSNRLDWKIIGIEGSVSREFGDYMTFREKVPDSIVTIVDRRNTPGSLGMFTDFNFKLRNKKSMGMNFGGGTGFTQLKPANDYYRIRNSAYFIAGYHFTSDRYTGYFQGRFGDYFAGFFCGLTYRL